jgi:hypothetical protein
MGYKPSIKSSYQSKPCFKSQTHDNMMDTIYLSAVVEFITNRTGTDEEKNGGHT